MKKGEVRITDMSMKIKFVSRKECLKSRILKLLYQCNWRAEDMWDIQEKVINNCPTYCNRNRSIAQSVILEVGVVVVVMIMVMMKLVVFQLRYFWEHK
jgi:hypothetical protein